MREADKTHGRYTDAKECPMNTIGSATQAWRVAYSGIKSETRKSSGAQDSTEKHNSEAYGHLPVAPDSEHGGVNIEA